MKALSEAIVLLLVCGVVNAVTDEVMTVMEGDSVTFDTGVNELKGDNDHIMWRFVEVNKRPLIVQVNKNDIEYDDERFKDRLQIQVGSLTIKNMKTKFTGTYMADIQVGTPTIKNFKVTVIESPHVSDEGTYKEKSVSVMEKETVTLHTDDKLHRDDLIVWRFGPEGVLIAKYDKEDNKSSIYDEDERFRGRLKMDDHTGDLIMTDTKTTDTGVYKLKLSSNNKQTFKTFSVHIKERGQSAGEITGIFFGALLAAVAAVGVFYYCHKNLKCLKLQALERSSVTLHTGVKLQSDDETEWSFRDKVIYTFKKIFIDERIRDRWQVDSQTGSLTIRSIRMQDAGLYKVKMSSSIGKSILQFITCGGPSYSQFNVIVGVRREENNSVTLRTGVTLQPNDEIQWRFAETLIAQIKNNTTSKHDDVLNKIFRGRLMLDDQTGDLTIRDLNTKHAGDYKLKIINSTGTSDSQINVIVGERIRSVELDGSVTLYTGVLLTQTGDEVQWRLGDEVTPIAKITVGSEPSYDERFRDRLDLKPQNGDLTITNITPELSGVYKATISSNSRETKYKTYKVAIHVKTYRGQNVTLHTESQIQDGSEMKWIYEENIWLVDGKKEGSNWHKPTEDERFRGRLKMDPETGDLTITDIRWTDDGLYTLQQRNTDDKISYTIFRVWVTGDFTPMLSKQNSDENLHNRTEKNESASVDIPLLNEAEARL